MIDKFISKLSKLFSVKTFLILGAVFLMASAFLGWIDQPIVGPLKGNKIRLTENLPPFISYGLLCFSAGLISFIALCKRLRWISILTGAIGLILSLNFFLSFSLFDSKRIIAINDFNQQEKRILSFHKFLPRNVGIEPTFDQSVTTDTISDRFYATFHFATLGWYASILGSLLLIALYVKTAENKKTKKNSFLAFSLLMLVYLSFTLPAYITAEYHRNKGDYYLADGMYKEAIDEYEIARRLDRNMDYQKSFHNNMGKAYNYTGRTDKADYYIYRANKYIAEPGFPFALFYFNTAKMVEPSMFNKAAGNSFFSWVYVSFGLSRYEAGSISQAIGLWEKALEIDSNQIQAYYYLSRAYYDMSSYEESIMAGLQFLKLSKNKIMMANVSSNIADSFYRLKNYDSARAYYLKSLLLDKFENLRAVSSLVGR